MQTYLDIQNLTKRIGDLLLLDGVSLSVGEGQKVGLIARNGAGKSTLMNIIAGREDHEAGSIVFRRGIRVGYLEQEPAFRSGATLIEAVTDGGGAILHDETFSEGLHARLPAEQILTKLGFDHLDTPVDLLSGGQRKRVALARVLMADPDLMILDEPTNHLDLEMIEWLEGYLQRSVRSLLMVTHDRYFLDRVCDTIIELDDCRLYNYRGNYAYYLEKRDERIQAENASLARTQNIYRRELEWMRSTPCARSSKARYRKEAFAELEQQARRRRQEQTARLEMKSGYIGSKIFEAEYVSKSFHDPQPDGTTREHVILRDFYYNFSRYEKMGIVGNNGTGKSTFLRLLLGELRPDSGRFVVGETVRFGYYSQQGMHFDQQMRVVDAVRAIAETVDLGGGRRLTASQLLTHFLFPPARQQDYIYKLSGGEKRRLYLCQVLMKNPNFLVLDEPTNDLDIPTLAVLENYLCDFRGCVIIVSHDRFFMDKVVDHLLVFRGNGQIDDFPGNYTQYRQWLRLRDDEPPASAGKASAPAAAPSSQATRGASRSRRLSYKERREMEQLESDIAALEAEKAQIEADLCSGTLSVEALTEKSRRLPQLHEELDAKSLRWLELAEVEG
ncbi:MAG: ribosomal protection-like ABC-F family protein [Alloprevotella sp.]